MADVLKSPLERVRPLIRVRQVREFTAEPVDPAELEAITEVARWSGSSRNEQPWRFVAIRDRFTIERIAQLGLPQTRGVTAAGAVVAIALPDEPGREISRAFDDGRAAERILIAAYALGLSAGVSTIRGDVRPAVGELLGLPSDRSIHTVVAIGHPTAEARRPKSPLGQARLPRHEAVFEERWPSD